MKRSPPGLAILGAGAVTVARHLPALRAVGGRPVCVFDPNTDTARSAAESFEIPCVASSAEEAIGHSDTEAVLVASPNAFHRAQAEAAFKAGRHVLCEKPVALSLADSISMQRAARRAGCVFQVGFHHRFSSEHSCAKQLIDLGVLGEVRAFSGSISEPVDVVPGGFENYRFNSKVGGGFTMIDLAQHRIDQIRDLLGDLVSISCDMASVLEDHDLDDSVVLAARMATGAIGSLHWNRFSRAFTSPLLLYGTKGTLGCSALITAPFQSAPLSVHLEDDPASVLPPEILSWTRPARWWGDLGPGWIDIWPPRAETFELQLSNFFESIRGDASPRASGVDGHKALEVVQAAYLAYKQGRAVGLPLSDGMHCDPPTWQSDRARPHRPHRTE